jgi:hypothetical protein
MQFRVNMGWFKGWFGEKRTSLSIWFSLDSATYIRFHDIIIPSKNGTAQIDHLIISKYGVFIVETKNKSGWIYGSEEQANWTQTFPQSKYAFQNPLRQIYRQKKVVSEFLQLDERLIHTVVYFVGDCEFKTPFPKNVLNAGLGSYIKGFGKQLIKDNEVVQLCAKLNRHVMESDLTKGDHLQSLKERHNSTTNCPKCGSPLVKRTVKNGSNTGTTFIGCKGYPKCRYTQSI